MWGFSGESRSVTWCVHRHLPKYLFLVWPKCAQNFTGIPFLQPSKAGDPSGGHFLFPGRRGGVMSSRTQLWHVLCCYMVRGPLFWPEALRLLRNALETWLLGVCSLWTCMLGCLRSNLFPKITLHSPSDLSNLKGANQQTGKKNSSSGIHPRKLMYTKSFLCLD